MIQQEAKQINDDDPWKLQFQGSSFCLHRNSLWVRYRLRVGFARLIPSSPASYGIIVMMH
jgi:hypothetical protein